MDRIVENASALFFLPGNYLLSAMLTHAPWLARFLRINGDDSSGVVVGIVSAVVWIGAAFAIGAFIELVRTVDRIVTDACARARRELVRGGRVLKTSLIAHAHALARRWHRRRLESPHEVGELDLEPLELAVLRAHAELGPGYMLTPIDIAQGHGVRIDDSRRALCKLRDYGLLERSFGARDQEEGYVLSAMGRSFLSAFAALTSRDDVQSIGSGGR
jgi:DNA-binding MarR family transcriptional regulator